MENPQTEKSRAMALRVRSLRLAGMTFLEAAIECGITKNAAIGLIQRHCPEMVERKPAAPEMRPLHAFEHLEPSQCRWPIGHPGDDDFGFCGARKERAEGPYCDRHREVAYIKGSDYRGAKGWTA